MWAKLIEMTMDGRLSIVWAGIVFLVLAAVWEGVSSRRVRNRRVSVGRNMHKN